MVTSACPGCGLVLPASPTEADGPTHPYVLSSAACWAACGAALARAYEDPVRREVLQVQVDAYAVQHPGAPGRRSAQSVALHLLTLCLVLERGADPREGPRLHRAMAQRPVWPWLEPPADRGAHTVADVLVAPDAVAHVERVRAWGASAWAAWEPHHATVRSWVDPAWEPVSPRSGRGR